MSFVFQSAFHKRQLPWSCSEHVSCWIFYKYHKYSFFFSLSLLSSALGISTPPFCANFKQPWKCYPFLLSLHYPFEHLTLQLGVEELPLWYDRVKNSPRSNWTTISARVHLQQELSRQIAQSAFRAALKSMSHIKWVHNVRQKSAGM